MPAGFRGPASRTLLLDNHHRSIWIGDLLPIDEPRNNHKSHLEAFYISSLGELIHCRLPVSQRNINIITMWLYV
jgi:hypothetical protein